MTRERAYRRIFKLHNEPPWICEECGEEVPLEQLTVHHVDENRRNNDPDNLVAMHNGCHTAHHRRGVTPSEETLRKRAKSISEHRKAFPFTEETKRKISEANKKRWAEGTRKSAKLGPRQKEKG